MKAPDRHAAVDAEHEISALIETLHQTGQRLEELTAGEVDAVADREGRTFLLRHAQEHLRASEAARQDAILNALPAQIALLDSQGRIISVNEAWRRFAEANGRQSPRSGIGVNYLAICDQASGAEAPDSRPIAAAIRAVLAGHAKSYSIEYLFHAPTGERWFMMAVTPLPGDPPHGAVVMHLDISERKATERTINRLNRVHAVLSGINTLIVRVHDRDELFRQACLIAVEAGEFRMAMVGIVDRSSMKMVLIDSAGADEEFARAVKNYFSSIENSPFGSPILARAITDKKPVVVNDLQSNPEVVFRKKYTEAGIHAMAVLPLIVEDEAVGVLILYSGESEFFQDDELKLLMELAGDISFAIDHIGKQERLNYLAYYDPLTGLANRTLFLERVAQYMRSAASAGHQLALFLLDLERFKNINDSLGRAAGDDLLRQVAQQLTQNVAGDASLLARIGADHFALVMPVFRPGGDLDRLRDRWIDAFLEHPFHLNDAVFRIGAKVGIAVFPDDGADADTLFNNAEAALKKVKTSGHRYLFYNRTMTEAVASQLTLENQLRQAIDNGEFVLYYQPKVNLVSGVMTSAEALIRWNDPRSGLVAPAQFIPILEETGLIHEVGRWVMRQAIADYLRWRAAGLAPVRIAVNVSALQLRSRGFIDEVRQAIAIDEHAPAGLEIEITESLIMENVKHSIASLQAIRALGISIAIDDFGTGFSSLSYLSRFPVNTLKIDRSFVIAMTDSPQGLALVSTIISLAHALDLKTVAEGVETEEQARLLRLLRCDEMQGYLFSKPLPAGDFESKFLAPLRAIA